MDVNALLHTVVAQLGQLQRDLTALAGETARLRGEVARLREEFAAVRLAVEAPEQRLLPFAAPMEPQLVTLDQMAALVGRQKDSLRHYRDQMPEPRVRGRRGQASLWAWPEVRPWLEQTFARRLPERFPTLVG